MGTRWQGVVSPLRGVALFEVGIALRAILGESMPLGWHAVPTLPEATRAVRSANPTRYKEDKGQPGTGILVHLPPL